MSYTTKVETSSGAAVWIDLANRNEEKDPTMVLELSDAEVDIKVSEANELIDVLNRAMRMLKGIE